MMTSSDRQRSRILRESDNGGQCVLYIMSRDQRVRDDYALLAAQQRAIVKKLPFCVIFWHMRTNGYENKNSSVPACR